MEHVRAKLTVLEGSWRDIWEQRTKVWPWKTDAQLRGWGMECFGGPPEAILPTVSGLGVENPALA